MIDELFLIFDRALRAAEYLPMGDLIVDATLVAAPPQRLTRPEKEAGEPADAIWPGQAAKAAQKDLDTRWTVKTGRQRPSDGTRRQLPTITIPVFGTKNHVAIDRWYGFVRRAAVTDAACHDGSMLPEPVTSDNLAASAWADTAYRAAPLRRGWRGELGAGLADPPEETTGPADAAPHRPRQRADISSAREGRARLCSPEGAHGAVCADDRYQRFLPARLTP